MSPVQRQVILMQSWMLLDINLLYFKGLSGKLAISISALVTVLILSALIILSFSYFNIYLDTLP